MDEDDDDNIISPPSMTGHQAVQHPPQPTLNDQELHGLIAPLVPDHAMLAAAWQRAARYGVPVDWLLIKEGLLNEAAYFQTLGEAAGVSVIEAANSQALLLPFHDNAGAFLFGPEPRFFVAVDGFALVPHGLGPSAIRAEIEALLAAQTPAGGGAGRHSAAKHPGARHPGAKHPTAPHIRLTNPSALRHAFSGRYRQRLLSTSRDKLFKTAPAESAKGGLSRWQWLGLIVMTMLAGYSWHVAPAATALGLSSFFALFFFMLISLWMMAAVMHIPLKLSGVAGGRAAEYNAATHGDYAGDEVLPVYTVLVPLFREAHMLSQLTRALNALDYPRARLDIKLLLEERDAETIAAARQMNLPGCYEVLVVPDGKPLTKPKALNYGLQFARGDYVVIFDAEDVPEPDQLRKALAVFANESPKLATLQAKLNLYNPRQNWLTRQFTIEYSALFDRLLGVYFFVGFPIPLGGTSNHFRAVM